MDHREIEERDLALLYLQGKLGANEQQAFEEHFVDCPACLERIEVLQGLRRGLTQLGSEEVRQVPPREDRVAWFTRLAGWQQAGLGFALAAIAAVAIGLPLIRILNQRNEAIRAAASWQQRYRAEQDASAKLRAELASNQTLAGAVLFPLVTTRSVESVSVNRIVVRRLVPWIVISLDAAPGFSSFRATLKDNSDATVWQADNLSPSGGSLALVLPAVLLKNGNYTLAVEGVNANAPPVAVHQYFFQASVRE